MTPLAWHILAAVHRAAVESREPWTVTDLSRIVGAGPEAIRKTVLRMTSIPALLHLNKGDRVSITIHGTDTMIAAGQDPRLDVSARPFKEAVLSGAVERLSEHGYTTLVPSPHDNAALPTGGTRGGRKAPPDTAAMMDLARSLGMSVDTMVDRLVSGKLRVCRQCGVRDSGEFEKPGRALCNDCRREQDKVRRPGRYRDK